MAEDNRLDVRMEIFRMLLEKVAGERHPSGSTLNMIEQLLSSPDDKDMYVRMLLQKMESDKYPSIDMLNRLLRQAA